LEHKLIAVSRNIHIKYLKYTSVVQKVLANCSKIELCGFLLLSVGQLELRNICQTSGLRWEIQ